MAISLTLNQGASTIEEAVDRFYDDPDKYSRDPVKTSSKSDSKRDSKQIKSRDYLPPAYAPRATNTNGQSYRPHTNPVIEAGHIRAIDEVRLFLVGSCD